MVPGSCDQDGARAADQGRQLAAPEVGKVRRELAAYQEFASLTERIVEVNEAICEARPASGTVAPSAPEGEKGALRRPRREKTAEIGRLAAEAAKALGCGDAGMQAAEQVLRAGLLKLGADMLGQLLAADPGYRGSRAACGNGHEAGFIAYRDKVIDTVLGPITLTRAWYHCAACGHGLAPRDAELGAAGSSLSPGLAAMNDRAAAAVPFREAAGLLEDLAGVRLTVKRVERAAEASGAAAAAAVRERAALITARKLVPLPPAPPPDKLHAAIDGTGIPVTSKETAGRAARARTAAPAPARSSSPSSSPRTSRTRTVPRPDRGSESYVATFEPAATFGNLVKAEEIRHSADHVRQLTILGDGAPGSEHRPKFPEPPRSYLPRPRARPRPRPQTQFILLQKENARRPPQDLDYVHHGIVAATRKYPLIA